MPGSKYKNTNFLYSENLIKKPSMVILSPNIKTLIQTHRRLCSKFLYTMGI